MDPRILDSGMKSSAQKTMSSSEIFATVQQLSAQIDGSRIPQVVDAIKGMTTEDKQLIVDLLGIALEKHHHLLMDPDRIMNLLIQIAWSANIVSRNHTLCSHYLTPDIEETSPSVYIVQGEPSARVRVMKRGEKGAPTIFRKATIVWVHLSHTNVLPVYGAFLDGKDSPISLVSPWLNERNIVDHALTLIQAERMPLIVDVINGLCYLHQLNIVHGAVKPQSVLISDSGHALITNFDGLSETSTVRYSAPEVLEDDDAPPTKAADVWAFGCLCYEVLSGNAPFFEHRQETKVVLVVVRGKQPSRPSQEGTKIDDVTWRPVSACWEFEPEDRPDCLKLYGAIAGIDIHDDRPTLKSMIRSGVLGKVEVSATDLENTRSLLNGVFGSNQLLPPPSQIPEYLREPLSGLADNISRANTVVAAAKKFNPRDTQTLVDTLDLVLEENPSSVNLDNTAVELLGTLMASTYIYPQRYRVHRIRYDPSSIAEDNFGKVHRGRDLDVCVNVVTDSSHVANISKWLALWACSSHPNVLPFYGIFDETVNEISRFCLVSPYLINGTLHDYAPHCPKDSRISLISDVIRGVDYIHRLGMYLGSLRPDLILISDEKRALVTAFNTTAIVTCTTTTQAVRSSALYELRFYSPEEADTGKVNNIRANIWSFGCLCYQVLSGKLPYHQYVEEEDIKSDLSQGEPPKRPSATDCDIDVIEDQFWDLITGCCRFEPEDRLTASEIKKLLINLRIQDDRPDAPKLPGTAIMSLRKRPDIEWDHVKQLLGQIQVELLRKPLSKVIRSHIKDVAVEAVKFSRDDVQTLVDFLDMTLKDHLTISGERNRVLALLSRIMTSAKVFPQRHELKGIKYNSTPIAEGGFGKVHRGLTDPTICIKVTTKVNDPHALVAYIKELVSWAHSSHPNVLPFYGVFFNDSHHICLVSPYMTKGNLRDYGRQLPQKSRVPMLLDTIKGLDYLHGIGVVHTDLKGENVLISDEGRALITDFGASHIVTATAKGGITNASVASTLRFTAPEIIRDQLRQVRPTKECDIWSFGCLCYEVLSRKLPYYEYQLDAQVFAALFREQLPKLPGPTKTAPDDDDDWDDLDEKDWDDLDETTWRLIVECLVPKPEGRPSASRIQELIIDMKAWDSRPPTKGVSGAEILKQRSNVEVNLNRAGSLLDHLQILFLARSIYRHSDHEVITAVAKLNDGDATTLTSFWALALENHLSIFDEQSRLLALHSAVTNSQQQLQVGYLLRTRPQYHTTVSGKGSFGNMYRGSEVDVCVKVTKLWQMSPHLQVQWHMSLAAWAHVWHPSILPFYGVFLAENGHLLVSSFINNGNLQSYAPRLPQKAQLLLISDVIEGMIYLHKLGIIHGNLKTQNVLISDEGRGIITDFRPYLASVAAEPDEPTEPFIISTLRFTAPELVKNSQMLPTAASDVWSVGCLFYEVLSQKVPYYTYTSDSQIRTALSQGEVLIRPVSADTSMVEIDDQSWDLITHCCALEAESRLKLTDIQNWLGKMGLEDNRPASNAFPGAEILKERWPYDDVDIHEVEEILNKLQAHLTEIHQEGVKVDEN